MAFQLKAILRGQTCRAGFDKNHRMRIADIDRQRRVNLGADLSARRFAAASCLLGACLPSASVAVQANMPPKVSI